jgi:hypothetical protein
MTATAAEAPDTIVVSRDPGETRCALLAGDAVLEVIHVRDAEVQPGATYRGRVVGATDDAHAYFVDLGVGPPGLLQARALAPEIVPTLGRAIAVIVMAAARADKGPKLKLAGGPLDSNPPDSGPVEPGPPAVLRPAGDPAAQWFEAYSGRIDRVVAAPGELGRLRALLGADAPIEPWRGRVHPFAALGIDEAIERALDPVVPLPGGGSLIIESTAAAVTVDVNAGSGPAARANHDAMPAVAREVRLRNIAGHILIDVVPTKHRRTLLAELKRALVPDPMTPEVAGFTPLGMIELTRRRVRPSLAEAMASGPGYAALRRAVDAAVRAGLPHVRIMVSAVTAAQLAGPLAPAVAEAASITRGRIEIAIAPDAPASYLRIEPFA